MTDWFGDNYRDIVFKYMFRIPLTDAEKKRLFPDGTSDPEDDKKCKGEPERSIPNTDKFTYWHDTKKKS